MEMTAVDFIRTKERMCHKLSCLDCPISMNNNNTGKGCDDFINDFPSSSVLIVKRWGEENPFMTNLDKFKEVFGVDYPASFVFSNEWWGKEYKGGD